jgi:hypothetical protein
MAVGTLIKKIFATDEPSAAAVVLASYIKALEDKDKDEREAAQRLVDWYSRDRAKIIDHLKTAGKKTFESLELWQFPIINGVRRTIQRLSMVYKDPPVREYWKGNTQLKPASAAVEAIERMLKGIQLNRKMRALDRWSTLLNTVHVEVVYRNGAIDWDVRLRPTTTVVPDPEDYLELSKFAYQWVPDPETLLPLKGWVYWTDEIHQFITERGTAIGMSTEDGRNPYLDPASGKSVIPVVTVRKLEDVADYWGRYGADLVDAMEASALLLGNIWETTGIQAHGQPFGINLNLKAGEKLIVGARNPIIAEKVTKDLHPPSLTFPKPDPDIKEVQDLIDWFIKSNAAAYGLPPSAWALDEQRMSGFAKFMDNIELIEDREEQLEGWEAVEQDLYRKSVIVWNTWAPDSERVPEDVEIRLRFPKPKVPETPTEESTRWAVEIKSGLASYVDFYQETEGLNAEDALKRALEVAKVNKQVNKAGAQAMPVGLPPDVPEAPETPEEEGEGLAE